MKAIDIVTDIHVSIDDRDEIVFAFEHNGKPFEVTANGVTNKAFNLPVSSNADGQLILAALMDSGKTNLTVKAAIGLPGTIEGTVGQERTYAQFQRLTTVSRAKLESSMNVAGDGYLQKSASVQTAMAAQVAAKLERRDAYSQQRNSYTRIRRTSTGSQQQPPVGEQQQEPVKK